MYEPEKYKVYPEYRCKKCGVSHMVRSREVNWPGGILCYCGEKISFKPIKKFKIKAVWDEKTSPIKRTTKRNDRQEKFKNEEKGGEGEKQEVYAGLVAGLVRLGFKKMEAEKRAAQAIEKCGQAPIEELIKIALQ